MYEHERAETNCTEPDEETAVKRKNRQSWLTQHCSQFSYLKAQVIATYLSMLHEVPNCSFIKQAQLICVGFSSKLMARVEIFVDYEKATRKSSLS